MGSFRIIALTHPRGFDPSIAIAASRAGELGVLDLEHAGADAAALEAITLLTRQARGECGVKLDAAADEAVLRALLGHLRAPLTTVLLAARDPETLARKVGLLKARDLDVLVEVTSAEQARVAQAAGADGLVAKGHEAGGWVGEETTFVLLQQLLRGASLPVFGQGGIGIHTAAAAYAAGAAGVALDSQLALTRESPLPQAVKDAIRRMDGSETACLGAELGAACRVYARPGQAAVEALRAESSRLHAEAVPPAEARAAWRRAVEDRLGWGSPEREAWPLGQDAAFAARLADTFGTVGGVLAAIRQGIDEHVRAARAHRPLEMDGPLAESHGTTYPVVQGPMTRVSDRAEFALAVAEGGGLPFLALALMRGPEVEALLEQTRRLLAGRPWGVGILGFVPLELRQEQLELVRAYRPPFALIAGGRPDQARALENDGIPTYLHVPSPGLLRLFLQDGARRFVFEGRECGGHVGPRSSFVLWELMVDVLLEALPAAELQGCHVLFAGGIHDALSASMVATLSARLAERGARVGVLLGTAYLFTEEAVSSGAIVRAFQEEALRCRRTVLLETGPGHSTRCAETSFAESFQSQRRRLVAEGRSPEEVRNELEILNIGRLRLASKGVVRDPRFGEDPLAPKVVPVDEGEQRRDGMYMIGQVAALREQTCTVEELHRSVSVEGTRRLETLAPLGAAATAVAPRARPSSIAIVGLSCMLPKAHDRQTFWENVLNKVSALTEIPKERFDWRLYFDADPKAPDKIYSKWGGFLDDEPFDPVEFGMPPSSLASIDPVQLLALKAAREALRDAGYLDRAYDRSRTSVILGASGGTGDLGVGYLLRSGLPALFGEAASEVIAGAGSRLPEWTEDSFAGLLLNVAAGRIANRFDFGGLNYVVDAACASSLTAVHLAVKELETHNTDMVVVGGVDTTQNPFGYLCFSKTRALSPTGQPRTFDASADGIAISEGIVMVVLKRLVDAERDGDRIYAVIQAVGGSSDGRAKGLTAPRSEGQMLALQRAYEKAGVSPTTVGLFEAHGTGTVVGDRTEVQALSAVLEEAGAPPQSAAIGSVKSMIGHTKATAGVAGLAKMALALYHKILPPTLGVTRPNPAAGFGEGPLYVNSESRPWIHADTSRPRRAGVNAFGFGGTNFHAILEEYTGEYLAREAAVQRRPTELCLFVAPSRGELAAALASLDAALLAGARPELRDLAYTLVQVAAERAQDPRVGTARLAIVASSLDDLRQKLGQAREALAGDAVPAAHDPRGVYFAEGPAADVGKLAFLFPGQGSQYPNMLRDLALEFAEVREAFERADRALDAGPRRPLSSHVYPPPSFTPEEERAQQQALTQTDVAQPALGAANMALFALLGRLGLRPEMVGGHSYGEYVALCAAGVFDEETLARVSEARGRSILEAAKDDLGTMAAVDAGPDVVARAVGSLEDVWIANLNSPEQTIVSGSHAGVARALQRFKDEGLRSRPLAVACAFHSPLVAPARERLGRFLGTLAFAPPRLAVFSNTTAAPYPHDPAGIAALLGEHLGQPVRFAEQIEAMYQAGARVFVEVGPRNVLAGLVRQTLGDRAHLAVATDAPGRPGLTQLHHALAQLAAYGVPVRLDRLFQGRAVRRLDLAALAEDTREKPLSPTTWLVSGGGIRPAHQPHRALPPPPQAAPRPAAAHGNGHGNGNGIDMSHDEPAASLPRAAAAVAPTPGRANGTASPLPPQTLPAAAAAPVARAGAEEALVQFQGLMGRFLETQRSVMLAYLHGADAARPEEASRPLARPAVAAVALDAPGSSEVAPTIEHVRAAVEPAALPPAPAAASDPPAPRGRADRAQLTEKLLQIVGDRTGYPPDMLDLDVDIEADLGIDSIKRVEILGTVQRACLPADRPVGERVMEQLTGIKTLRGIVDWLDGALEAAGPAADAPRPEEGPAASAAPSSGPAAPPATAPADPGDASAVPRSVVSLEAAPALPDRAVAFAPERAVIVTDDEHGVARHVSEELRRQGARVALVRHRTAGENGHGEAVYRADLTDPAQVAALCDLVRRDLGPIGGLVHLLPLFPRAEFEAMDLAAWRAALAHDVKSLFHLAKAAAHDLKTSGNGHANRLLAATGLGADDFFPGHGGVGGMVKSIAHEWPGVPCKVLGLDVREPASVMATHVLRELAADDGLVELAYGAAGRQALRPRLAALDAAASPRLDIQPDWVILVTGGARGITAEVACHLAERYRPTLALVGRSALPEREESPETRELSSPQALKAALLAAMRRTGQAVTVSNVEAAYQRLLKDREMRAALCRIEATGAKVRYYQADARDEAAMRGVVEAVHREHGRLDGVIHGAGVIEDKLVEDKTAESFDRVFDTKAESAFVLSRILRAESLRFLAFFGSAAGSFGNRGQADYAAANEVLSKLALHLDRRWPGRVVSIAWGPWLKTGMVSPEMQREFARRGVDLISIPSGCRLFDREIRHGGAGDAQVIVAGGTWSAPETERRPRPLPLLEGAVFSTGGGHLIEAVRTLDPAVDLYLLDHRIDGSPVLPLAVATELMAEVVQESWPDLEVVGVRELQLFKGVVLDHGPRAVRVLARAQAEPPHDRAGIDVSVELKDAGGSGQILYRATVELASALPAAPVYAPPAGHAVLRPFPLTTVEAYRQWLFHGPRFQAITSIDGVAERDIRATLDASAPPPALREPPDGRWVIDPVMFDGGLQLFLLWARAQLDRTLLPSRFQRYRRFGSLSGSGVRCHVHVLERSRDPLYYVNIAFVGGDGRLLGLLEEIEGASSRALNRLSGAPVVPRAAAELVGESPSL